MSDDLIAWLRAQLDDDERVAWACGEDWTSPGRPASWAAGFGSGTARAEFIDAWSPARVLAEVEAKRRILDEHRSIEADDVPGLAMCLVDHEVAPCDHVRLLAQPYADRPGFREEWRP